MRIRSVHNCVANLLHGTQISGRMAPLWVTWVGWAWWDVCLLGRKESMDVSLRWSGRPQRDPVRVDLPGWTFWLSPEHDGSEVLTAVVQNYAHLLCLRRQLDFVEALREATQLVVGWTEETTPQPECPLPGPHARPVPWRQPGVAVCIPRTLPLV